MGHNLAIVVGINEYERLKRLKYAKQDALRIKQLLEERGEVESVLLFTDDSDFIDGRPTRATHTNLRDLLFSMFEEQFLHSEDNLWFFFSGHGLRQDQRDYLLPVDGNPRDVDGTCITVDFVTKRLSRSGAGNIVLILDACRNALEGAKGGEALGEEAKERVRERGLISIFACRPDEQSWEEDALGQGIFTFALVKALQEGGCATVRQINSYLKIEVAELAKRYGKAPQTPWLVAEPIEKADLILSLKNVKEADLDGLKKTALEQEAVGHFDLALELWNRINIAAYGRDREFYAAFERLQGKRLQQKTVREPLGIEPEPAEETVRQEQKKRLETQRSGQKETGKKSPQTRDKRLLHLLDRYSWVPFALTIFSWTLLPINPEPESTFVLAMVQHGWWNPLTTMLWLGGPAALVLISSFYRYPLRRIAEAAISGLHMLFLLIFFATVVNKTPGVGTIFGLGFEVLGTIIKAWLLIRRRELEQP